MMSMIGRRQMGQDASALWQMSSAQL